ncbi:hypothetical protein IVB16_00375 [Bradyrhizobium sp. 183]|uniref:hypothetical protein n=1 Tax=unclassified Bradyrhizobium TaxID=2631580 RepID=UPI001FFF9E14|nr:MULTISPECIES: hypothetical protein [unclassified Bradyrhizobium]UPJ80532.1 hypothetical protein IVB17_00375 [Bradyrhizobium sp. 184]UPJ88326.1 hypothetical protein IVB16_00375 [Bradyrhizobium sp. 183]
MTELRPYFAPPPPPLTAGARFIRGFKRVGMVVAGLVLLVGLFVSYILAREAQERAEKRFSQATCIASLVRNNRPLERKSYDRNQYDFSASGCPGYSFDYEPVSAALTAASSRAPAPLEYAIEPFSVGAAVSIGLAATAFLGLWMLGWLCAGFTRD